VSIDLTPDVIAVLNEVQTSSHGFKYDKESIEPYPAGRDTSTRVQFT
jgi:hypothetical protein